MNTTESPKPKFKQSDHTADICICAIIDDQVNVLLILRGNKDEPFYEHWAIPGGYLDIKTRESLDEAALRELREETSITNVPVRQLHTYSDPDRDPRPERTITTAYYALISNLTLATQTLEAKDDAKEYAWFPLNDLPDDLAFDHTEILGDLSDKLGREIIYTPIAFELLGDTFTWTELQAVYEDLLNEELVAPNFRRKIETMYNIVATNQTSEIVKGRPPVLMNYKGVKKAF
jgi:8-oxo-dGTP diphosphatase